MSDHELQLTVGDKRDVYWEVMNDTLASAAWTSSIIYSAGVAPLSITGAAVSVDSLRAFARISSEEAGVYELMCSLVCASGQEFNRKAIVVFD